MKIFYFCVHAYASGRVRVCTCVRLCGARVRVFESSASVFDSRAIVFELSVGDFTNLSVAILFALEYAVFLSFAML